MAKKGFLNEKNYNTEEVFGVKLDATKESVDTLISLLQKKPSEDNSCKKDCPLLEQLPGWKEEIKKAVTKVSIEHQQKRNEIEIKWQERTRDAWREVYDVNDKISDVKSAVNDNGGDVKELTTAINTLIEIVKTQAIPQITDCEEKEEITKPSTKPEKPIKWWQRPKYYLLLLPKYKIVQLVTSKNFKMLVRLILLIVWLFAIGMAYFILRENILLERHITELNEKIFNFY